MARPPTQELSDEELLAAARGGDAAAIDALVARHEARVFRFGMKMCRDPEDAKDVLQETLLALARGVREFRGESSISTWLYSVARSHCIKKHRKRRDEPNEFVSTDDAGDLPSDDAHDPEQTLARRQLDRALRRAIDSLDQESKEVLVLRDMEGLTAPEVAAVVGASVDAVKSRLHRARVAVRASLVPLLEAPPAETRAAANSCPDVVLLLSQHMEDEISADVCARMEAHVSSCARCRSACDSLRRTLALCRTSGTDVAVPAAVQSAVRVAIRDFLAETNS